MPAPYLTPARYLSMGSGLDLSQVDDQTLSAHIQIASGLVNSYCSVPDSYDFRGGTVINENHIWKINNHMWPASNRLFPKRGPLRELTSFRIHVTNTQYLDVPVAQVRYYESENFLEPVIASSSVAIWSYSVVPIAGLRHPEAEISYTYGYRFSVTDDPLFPEGGTIWRAMNQWWDDAVPPTVTVTSVDNDVVVLTVNDLTIDYDEGTASLDDPGALGFPLEDVATVKADYTYRLPTNIMTATSVITTSLLGQRDVAARGLLGLSGIRVEEVEIRQSRDAQLARDEIPGVAKSLLRPYQKFSWGA